jgi:glutaredoxin
MTKFVVYSKPECPWCDKIKDLLIKERRPFEEIDVAHSMENLMELKTLYPEVKTVPQLFLMDGENATRIGGYGDAANYFLGKGDVDAHKA